MQTDERDNYGTPTETADDTPTPGWGYHREIAPLVPAEPEADDVAEGDEAAQQVESSERQQLVERDARDADDGDEGSDDASTEIVDLATGEPIPAAQRAEIERLVTEAGLEHSFEEYLAAKEGIDFTPEDAEAVASFTARAFEAKMSPDQLRAAYEWYAEGRAAQHQADLATRDAVVASLQETWGKDNYAENINTLRGWLNALPEGLGPKIGEARLPDGTLLLNADGFADAFLQLAKSGARADPSAKERLATISETLATNPSKYWREGLDKEAVKLRSSLESGREEVQAERQPVSRREAEILRVMKTDTNTYFKKGLDRELAQIRAARASRGR